MSDKIIILVLWFLFSIQILFYLFFYIRVFFIANNSKNTFEEEPVSVIISARNEFENLKNFLPAILKQKYPVFELIVINDASSDQSSDLLSEFSEKYSYLQIIDVKPNSEHKGKKNAITKGVEASKYEYLLFTDADCYPVSENWIATMMSGFTEGKEIVLGYGAYEQTIGFLNKLIRFETLLIALKYFSFAKAGIPYMGVGRNMAYKKSVFLKNKGFKSHNHLKSGDDDLFINEVANRKNTSVVISHAGTTKSVPEKTLNKLLKQKRRHLTTGFKYKLIHKILLGLESISSAFFYITIIIALSFSIPLIVIGIPYFLRLIIQIIILSLFSDKLKEKRNLIFIFIFDVLIPVLNLYAVVNNIFVKNKEWK